MTRRPHTVRPRRLITIAATMVTLAFSLPGPPAAATATPRHGGADAPTSDRRRPDTYRLISRAAERGTITRVQAALYLSYAFTAPERLPAAYASSTPWDGTHALLELRRSLDRLDAGPAVLEARSRLRAATFRCPGSSGPKPGRRNTAHFAIRYRPSSLRGLTVGSYSAALERSWRRQIVAFGWAKPPKDPAGHPKGGRYPVRITRLGHGLYGYVTPTGRVGNNPATSWNDRDAIASCMVVNADFTSFPGATRHAMQATVAHEFNHSITFGYGALTGFGNVSLALDEGGATWMEDEVFDDANDNYHFLWPNFTRPMGRYTAFPYPYWIVLRAMTEPFGTGTAGGGEDILQVFWEQISKGRSTNLAALDRGFRTKGSRLAEAYHDAAIALRFLRDCEETARPYCLQEGPDYPGGPGRPTDLFALAEEDTATGRTIANDFALNWVRIPTVAGLEIRIGVTRGKGMLWTSVACLDGDEVTVQAVGTATRATPAIETVDTAACDQASVVITNVERTAPTPASITKTTYSITTSR